MVPKGDVLTGSVGVEPLTHTELPETHSECQPPANTPAHLPERPASRPPHQPPHHHTLCARHKSKEICSLNHSRVGCKTSDLLSYVTAAACRGLTAGGDAHSAGAGEAYEHTWMDEGRGRCRGRQHESLRVGGGGECGFPGSDAGRKRRAGERCREQ